MEPKRTVGFHRFFRIISVNPGPGNMQLIYMGSASAAAPAPVDGDDILKINETLRESCYTKAFHEKFHGLFRQMRLAGRKGRRGTAGQTAGQ